MRYCAKNNLAMIQTNRITPFLRKHIVSIVFLVAALIMGGLIIKNTSTIAGYDYDAHYYTSYAIATGQEFSPKIKGTMFLTSIDPTFTYSSKNTMKVRDDFIGNIGQCGYNTFPTVYLLNNVFSHDPNLSRSCVSGGSPKHYSTVAYRMQYPQINYVPH